jgi:hypothetical protein
MLVRDGARTRPDPVGPTVAPRGDLHSIPLRAAAGRARRRVALPERNLVGRSR